MQHQQLSMNGRLILKWKQFNAKITFQNHIFNILERLVANGYRKTTKPN